jgi:hypothetical protein
VYGRANFTHAIQTLDNKTQMSKRTPGFLSAYIVEPVLHLAGSSIPCHPCPNPA